MRIYVPGNAMSSFFINFPILIGRILLSRRPIIIIAVIIDFIYRESIRGILSTVVISLAIAFVLLLIMFFFYVNIHANVIILFLTLSSRIISYISCRLACPDYCLRLFNAKSTFRLRERIMICLSTC